MKSFAKGLAVGLSIMLFAFAAVSFTCHAHDDTDGGGNYIFRNNTVQLSTFYFELAPATYLSSIENKITGFTNLSGGFILNNRFYLSAFIILSPTIEDTEYSGETVYISYRQAGLKLGYMHRTDRMVFWRTSLSIGLGGGYRLTDDTSIAGTIFGSWTYKASVFSLEPSIGVGFNLLPWWRLYLDIGYRIMGPSDAVVEIADDNSITLLISFGFGNFRYRQKDDLDKD